MTQVMQYAHTGWDKYYREQNGKRAWNAVPDQFLMEHFDVVLRKDAQNVLDVAAGDGRNSEPFLDRGLSVVAVDLSPAALRSFGGRCNDDGMQQPVLIAGDFLSLELIQEQFDCVVCFNSVPHFESPAACLEKIAQLLKPGGRAAFNAFTPGDVAFGQGEQIGKNRFSYKDTLFTFMEEADVKEILPDSVEVVQSETRRWEEPDHGGYRTGTHTHEACFFIIQRSEFSQ